MKVSTKKMAVLLILVLLVLISVTPAFSRVNQDSRVWVEYENGHKASVASNIRGMGGQFYYAFDRLNSLVVSLPPKAVENLAKNPQVVSIEDDPVRSLVADHQSGLTDYLTRVFSGKKPESTQVVPYGIDMVQARDIWDANRDGKIDRKAPTGAGRIACIIDTGFYDEHEDLIDLDVLGGYSQANENETDLWTRDGHGHGTHVAGTINADNNRLGVVGVSPGEASLFIIKIFGDDGLWVNKAHASDLVDAIYRCADAGANIISMSLSGTNQSGKERMAFDELYEQGILHVAAASNDGIEEYHYPASYDSVISVAAIDSNKERADFSQFNDQVELAAPGVGVLSTIPYLDISTVTVGDEVTSGYHVEYAGRGIATGTLADGGLCTSTGDWAGKVVLCYRGEISFFDKVMNVQNSGGVAAVIYNNLDEDLFATLGEGNSSEIVAISLSQAQGLNLLSSIDEDATVYSEYIWPTSGYEAWGGTSMATPHVSGVAALIWSANPAWTNVEIREAMAATAEDLGDPGRDVYYGFGLVQAFDALQYLQDSE
jgi:subtilisin family serine protease